MNKRYVCPKCRCGCLFEEKGKLICLNCDAEVRKASARGIRHEHHHQTYSLRTSDRPVTVTRKPVQLNSVFPASTGIGSRIRRPSAKDGRLAQKSGCGLWIVLFIVFFWLLPALISLLSFAA